MSTSSFKSPLQSKPVIRFFFLLGTGLILVLPLELLTSGIVIVWSEMLLNGTVIPYPDIQNFSSRIFIELFLGPLVLLWSIPKLNTRYQTSFLIKLLALLWSFVFFIFGCLGVFSSVLDMPLFGVSSNIITYFCLVYGPVLFVYTWRERIPAFSQKVYQMTTPLAVIFRHNIFSIFSLILGIGLLVIVPLELISSGARISLKQFEIGINFPYPAITNFKIKIGLEIFFGILLIVWSFQRIKSDINLKRQATILSTVWGLIFLLFGGLGFFAFFLNNSLFGVSDTSYTVLYIIYGLMAILYVWKAEIVKYFSQRITLKTSLANLVNSQAILLLIFLIGLGLTLIIPLDFLGSKVVLVWPTFSLLGVIFPFPSVVNLNQRILFEILIGPLLLKLVTPKVDFQAFLVSLKEQTSWKFIAFPFPIFLIVFLRSYLLFFESYGLPEVGVDIVLIIFRSSFFIGSIYILLGIGLSLTFKILNFANFSHGELVVYGPYIVITGLPPFLVALEAFLTDAGFTNIVTSIEPIVSPLLVFLEEFLSTVLGINFVIIPFIPLLIVNLAVACLASAFLALVVDFLVFRPLRARDATPMTLMIASIGVSFIIRVLLTDAFSQSFSQHSLQILGQPTLYDLHVLVIIIGIIFVIMIDLLITRTKLGKAMRAMADNPDLAQASGISKGLIIALVWVIGAGLAGMGGVLRFLANMTLFPDRGFLLLLPTFAVVILGGIGSYRGSIVAGYIIGFAEVFGAFLISTMRTTTFGQIRLEIPIILGDLSSHVFNVEPSLLGELYQVAIGFMILVMVLLIKPTGIYGEDLAKDR